jgi:hypothetical protein
MGAYRPLFGVHVDHEYFGTDPCRAVELLPDSWSRALLGRASLVLEPLPGGVRVHYDEDHVEALRMHATDPGEPFRLVFRLRATDPSFSTYTAPESLGAGTLPYFSSRGARATEAGDALTWEAPDAVTDEDFRRLEELARLESAERQANLPPGDPSPDALRSDARLMELRSVVHPRDRFVRPIAIVSIWIDPPGENDTFPPAPGDYRVAFAALRTIWRYHLLGDLARRRDPPVQIDGDDLAEFGPGTEETLPDNRVALTFRSSRPIPLQARSDRRFQLREKRENGGRNGPVLIRRLPVAAPDGFGGVELFDGKKTIVSDIYING